MPDLLLQGLDLVLGRLLPLRAQPRPRVRLGRRCLIHRVEVGAPPPAAGVPRRSPRVPE